MPKVLRYTKGSIIYFDGDLEERVFILQNGCVILTSIDVETKSPVVEQVKSGEFFGVKSALGHFPREEKATAITDAVCVTMTIPEFEAVFSSNKQLIMKMLRVFSAQLRQMHKKTESILNKGEEINKVLGLYSVAQAFYNDEKWRSCADVCQTFIKRYPTSPEAKTVSELCTKALAYSKRDQKSSQISMTAADASNDAALKIFSLPAFQRFAKTYEDGQVIITEFEPGETFYLIQSGYVQITKCANNTNKNLDILKPGDLFGEMAILDNTPRSATCVANGRVECLEFNKANFEVLVTGNPLIALKLLKLFCSRIKDQKRRLKTLTIADTQARVADVFCMYNEMQQGGANPAEKQRKFNLTVTDIVHWSGLPAETVRDEINRFMSSRKIEVYDSHIVVNNILDMKRIVDTRSSVRL